MMIVLKCRHRGGGPYFSSTRLDDVVKFEGEMMISMTMILIQPADDGDHRRLQCCYRRT